MHFASPHSRWIILVIAFSFALAAHRIEANGGFTEALNKAWTKPTDPFASKFDGKPIGDYYQNKVLKYQDLDKPQIVALAKKYYAKLKSTSLSNEEIAKYDLRLRAMNHALGLKENRYRFNLGDSSMQEMEGIKRTKALTKQKGNYELALERARDDPNIFNEDPIKEYYQRKLQQYKAMSQEEQIEQEKTLQAKVDELEKTPGKVTKDAAGKLMRLLAIKEVLYGENPKGIEKSALKGDKKLVLYLSKKATETPQEKRRENLKAAGIALLVGGALAGTVTGIAVASDKKN